MKGMMRTYSSGRWLLPAAALAFVLAACGGGGDGTVPVTSGGTTGFARGEIQKFGSIDIGDDRFVTGPTTIRKRLDDNTANIAGDDNVVFRKGMIVEVFHNANDNNAREVRFKDDLEGPITAIPAAPRTLPFTMTVLGVSVRVDNNTNLDDTLDDHASTGIASFDNLAVGNLIEVSGLFDNAGVLHATFIEAKRIDATGRTFEIKGNIADLAGTAPNQTYKVNGVAIQDNASTQFKDLPFGVLANGLFVEVKTATTTPPLIATRVEGTFEDPDHEVHAAQQASVEGFVTGLTGTTPNFSFTLSGTAVTTSSATVGVANVAPNAHIQAEGPVVGGVIKATKIGLRP